MKHTYTVTGMSCKGCRKHVEQTLNNVEGVKSASVDLAKAEAVIEMEQHIAIQKFQKALKEDGGGYG
ncbi:MAG: heavy-metal-associated domain-containing protein, partial [Leeuwenhoekiella sp.]|nr:heavy-metal-associated domain-containing protein [Leeuwenhoekiella sp.]